MKLKTVLKHSTATKISITVQTNGEYFDYDIDYTSKEPDFKCDTYARYNCINYIPDAVMNREVTFINVHNNTLMISVYEKED